MSILQTRLRNQGVDEARFDTPAQVVGHLRAMQSQDYLGAAWGIGLRAGGLTRRAVDAAFDAGQVLRTHVLRPTWHFVLPQDAAWLLELTAPRVQLLNGTMYRQLGLSEATLAHGDDVMAGALADGNYMTREELMPVLAAAGLPVDAPLQLTYLVMHAELTRTIISGPRKGKRFSYAAFAERVGPVASLEREAALEELARRYLLSRGPASERDLSRWSGLTLTDSRRAIDMVSAELESVEVDGVVHWLVPGGGEGVGAGVGPEVGAAPSVDPGARRAAGSDSRVSPSVHLVSVYDEYLAGYKGWEKVADAKVIEALVGLGNALTHVVLLDGRIVGSWRREFKKDLVLIEVSLRVELDSLAFEALRRAGERYAEFFGVQGEMRLA